MPYDNSYNRKLSSIISDNNRKFIENERKNMQLFHHNLMPSQFGSAQKNMEGSAVPKDLNNDVIYGVNQGVRTVYGDASQYGSNYGEKLDGGNGFARGTHMDTGYDRTIGGKKGVSVYKKSGGKKKDSDSLKLVRGSGTSGGKKRGRPSKKNIEGAGFMDVVKNIAKKLPTVAKVGLSMIDNPKAQMAANVLETLGAGKKRGRPSKKNIEGAGFMDVMKNIAKKLPTVAKVGLSMIDNPKAQMAADVLEKLGAGKKRGRPSKKMTGGTELGLPDSLAGGKKRGRPSKKKLEGEGFFGDMWDGIKMVAKPLASVAKVGLSLVPLPQAQIASQILDMAGAGKKKRGRPSKMSGGRALVPVANMQSRVGGKKVGGNKRSEIVKEIMSDKKLSMIEASKYVKLHNLYKP
jgi:hypothetical protein